MWVMFQVSRKWKNQIPGWEVSLVALEEIHMKSMKVEGATS